jgi:hypothetical protein
MLGRWALWGAMWGGLAGCGGTPVPGPCVECPSIGGRWTFRIYATDARLSTCGRLSSVEGSESVTIRQQGSALWLDELEVSGELREDGAFGFQPYRGVTLESRSPYQGTITAQLAGAPGVWVADGVLTAVLDEDGCRLVAPIKLSYVEP